MSTVDVCAHGRVWAITTSADAPHDESRLGEHCEDCHPTPPGHSASDDLLVRWGVDPGDCVALVYSHTTGSAPRLRVRCVARNAQGKYVVAADELVYETRTYLWPEIGPYRSLQEG